RSRSGAGLTSVGSIPRFETKKGVEKRRQEEASRTTSRDTVATVLLDASPRRSLRSIMSFASLGLAKELTRAVADEGYEHPTPIQREAIPLVLAGRDLIGSAQTGTGKTAAFLLPILQRLAGGQSHALRALILVPTRELAEQVLQSARTYGRHLSLTAAAIYGGAAGGACRRRGARARRRGQAAEAWRPRPHPAGEACGSDPRVHAHQVRGRQAGHVPAAGRDRRPSDPRR